MAREVVGLIIVKLKISLTEKWVDPLSVWRTCPSNNYKTSEFRYLPARTQ